jgi:hypothetical protein
MCVNAVDTDRHDATTCAYYAYMLKQSVDGDRQMG